MSSYVGKNYWVFLSYARRDAKGLEGKENPFFERFYKDLASEIGKVAAIPASIPEKDIQFYDREDIEIGADWSKTLYDALQSSKVFVCLFSPSYFKSEYCGKEFQVFNERVKKYKAALSQNVREPELIIPVLWENPNRFLEPLPEAVSGIQYADKNLGLGYSNIGVSQMLRLQKEVDYQEFLINLADKIYKEAQFHPMPPEPSIKPLKDVKSAFHVPPTPAVVAGAVPGAKGPSIAWFIYAAGGKADYNNIRQQQSQIFYGNSGLEWQPYYPTDPNIIHYIAATVATTKGLAPIPLAVSNSLIDQLEEAEDNNTIAVIIIDPWSIKLPAFEQPLKQFDRTRLSNCGVIIVWNENDQETKTARTALETLLQKTFSRNYISKDILFQPSISSETELRTKLGEAIEEVRKKIEERGKYLRGESGAANDPFPKLPTANSTPSPTTPTGGV